MEAGKDPAGRGMLRTTAVDDDSLFRLTVYAVPYYDDYNFGRFARAAMEQEQSKWAAISGALIAPERSGMRGREPILLFSLWH